MSQWISVEEQLPEELDSVLVFLDGEICVGYLSRGWFIEGKDNDCFAFYPTHWMPLPAPPGKPEEGK
jgi:hypothetical protein